jgi:hypothetical protein
MDEENRLRITISQDVLKSISDEQRNLIVSLMRLVGDYHPISVLNTAALTIAVTVRKLGVDPRVLCDNLMNAVRMLEGKDGGKDVS